MTAGTAVAKNSAFGSQTRLIAASNNEQILVLYSMRNRTCENLAAKCSFDAKSSEGD